MLQGIFICLLSDPLPQKGKQGVKSVIYLLLSILPVDKDLVYLVHCLVSATWTVSGMQVIQYVFTE